MSPSAVEAPRPPCLVLAPHLEYPARNGADILIDRRYKALSAYFSHVDIIGAARVVRYKGGALVSERAYDGGLRPKWLAAARTLLRQSHYLTERFVTGAFLRTALPMWRRPDYGYVVFSQLGVAAAAAELGREQAFPERHLIVETHNNDYTWFENIIAASSNPLLRLAAGSSLRWVDRFLREGVSGFTFVHISKQDQAGYRSKHPAMRSFVSPPGTDLHPLQAGPARDEKIRLLFVGSLGVKINLDALLHFRERFYAALLERFGRQLEVTVVGSEPSRAVRALCSSMSWGLQPNVSEDELSAQYRAATFSLLPFPYSTGAKLKLLDTLSHGVPFLATSEMAKQVPDTAALAPCLFSDDPAEWVRRVEQVRRMPPSTDFRQALLAFAGQYTWERLAERHITMLDSALCTSPEQA